jgi:hypothetical protein
MLPCYNALSINSGNRVTHSFIEKLRKYAKRETPNAEPAGCCEMQTAKNLRSTFSLKR